MIVRQLFKLRGAVAQVGNLRHVRRDCVFWGAQATSLQLPGASRQHVREAPARCAATREKVRRRRLRRPARWQRALPRTACRAFTLIELLVVMAIIIVLAGLILSILGYVQKKGYQSRAEAEIAAMSAALESYKADNGIYPRANADPTSSTTPYDTDSLDARSGLDPNTEINPDPRVTVSAPYVKAGLALYKQLSGDFAANRQPQKTYFAFPPAMLLPRNSMSVTALVDPFTNCYGYSTANQNDPNRGFNPTFDLWSTAGTGTGATPSPSPKPTPQILWLKNW